MNAQGFDAIARRLVAAGSRRHALAAVGGTLAAALLGGRRASAQDGTVEPAATCDLRLERCGDDRDCCESRGSDQIACDRLSQDCDRSNLDGDRCCGRKNDTCADDCDCCRNYRCNNRNRCERR